ncbi:hypothetical protein GC722_02000 [Auraticoccus sp. F435]|uniref:PE domain-containing protein n=1 Tax=Auraticoccus cholistanensis TaxID=2656650 RepID=A0A6A9UT12_9ACTN|nr:hypothetical protein [Auraticoccus cholistanensis]MVA74812.1 hypothetical protein [Auraticoccus cholistanensis]
MTDPSNITVDPGAIRDFARFLDAQGRRLERIRARMSESERRRPDFGAHPSAAAAERQHARAVSSAVEASTRLAVRHEELVAGTEELAKQYADLSELNRAASDEITAVMEQGAERA